VRFPGGSSGDIYTWQTGEDVAAWFTQFAGSNVGPQQTAIKLVAGRGGASLINAARLILAPLSQRNRAVLFQAGQPLQHFAFECNPMV
jgi:hypothetical protein